MMGTYIVTVTKKSIQITIPAGRKVSKKREDEYFDLGWVGGVIGLVSDE